MYVVYTFMAKIIIIIIVIIVVISYWNTGQVLNLQLESPDR